MAADELPEAEKHVNLKAVLDPGQRTFFEESCLTSILFAAVSVFDRAVPFIQIQISITP